MDAAEFDFYMHDSANRLRVSCTLLHRALADRCGLQVLEIGRMPDNAMLRGIADLLDTRVAVVEGPTTVWPGSAGKPQMHRESACLDHHPVEFDCATTNLEIDPLPWKEHSFDLVLFCEVLEHLLHDPVHALVEMGRVLKPGGLLLLTTPNVLCWMNPVALLLNRNPRDLYSGYGPYGRHNREFAPYELRALLTSMGYRIEKEQQVYQPPIHRSLPRRIAYALGSWLTLVPIPILSQKHGTNLIYLLRKDTAIVPAYPSWLFRSWPDKSRRQR